MQPRTVFAVLFYLHLLLKKENLFKCKKLKSYVLITETPETETLVVVIHICIYELDAIACLTMADSYTHPENARRIGKIQQKQMESITITIFSSFQLQQVVHAKHGGYARTAAIDSSNSDGSHSE